MGREVKLFFRSWIRV